MASDKNLDSIGIDAATDAIYYFVVVGGDVAEDGSVVGGEVYGQGIEYRPPALDDGYNERFISMFYGQSMNDIKERLLSGGTGASSKAAGKPKPSASKTTKKKGKQ